MTGKTQVQANLALAENPRREITGKTQVQANLALAENPRRELTGKTQVIARAATARRKIQFGKTSKEERRLSKR
jgi:hypothetical protein